MATASASRSGGGFSIGTVQRAMTTTANRNNKKMTEAAEAVEAAWTNAQ